MKICIPVDQINGLNSEIAPNFRAAPALLVVDSVTKEFKAFIVPGLRVRVLIDKGAMGQCLF